MTLSTLATIRAGIVTNLNALKAGYQDMQISAYVLANATLPVIWIKPTPDVVTDYHQTFETLGATAQFTWYLTVEAFVVGGGDIAAQQWLDELLNTSGSHSVKAAVESDTTLGGVAETLIVRRSKSYQEYARQDGVLCLGAAWDIEVS